MQKKLTREIIEELPNICEDLNYDDGIVGNLKYIRFLTIEYTEDGILFHCDKLKKIFTKKEINILKNWEPDNNFYVEDYYRIDLNNYIYIFQVIHTEDNYKILCGNLLRKDFQTRLILAETYQTWIMEKLKYA